MTEAEAGVLLRDWLSFGGFEGWMAEQPWEVARGGWTITGELQGWRFRIVFITSGLRITAGEPDAGDPAVWIVTS